MKKLLFTLFIVSLNIVTFGQENPSRKSLEKTNIENRMNGYYPAGSKVEDKTALGGFWASQNFPKTIDPNMNIRQGEISLVALPDEETVFAEKSRGMKLLLVNTTNEQVTFSASDSLLYIVQEALDQNGKWKTIELMPFSSCGNSNHNVFLGANEYWEFAAARYTGNVKTRLRFRLIKQKSKSEQSPIYSNDFEGSVNQKQLDVR
jgi:hypothetical protein